jgi:hypothetical protein
VAITQRETRHLHSCIQCTLRCCCGFRTGCEFSLFGGCHCSGVNGEVGIVAPSHTEQFYRAAALGVSGIGLHLIFVPPGLWGRHAARLSAAVF